MLLSDSMLTADAPVHFDDPLPSTVDVAVIGGGVIGVCAAWFLAERGQRVALLEKGRIGAEQSRRNWGWIRQHGRDRAELPIVTESIGHWAQLARDVDEDIGFTRRGVVYLASNETELAARARWLDIARDHDLDSRLLSRAELDELIALPGHRWIGGAYTPGDARAEPFVAVPAIARKLRQHPNVSITEHCAARTLDLEAGAVRGVVTERGVVKCAAVICAGGAWTSLFTAHHGYDFPHLSVRATVARSAPAPDFFAGNAASSNLAFRRRADGGYTLAPGGHFDHFLGRDSFRHARRFLPSLLRSRGDFAIRFGGAADRPRAAAPWTGDSVSPFEQSRVLNPAPSAKALAALRRAVASELPALAAVPLAEAWAGMIDATPDVVPVIDHLSAIPGLFVAAGFSGHGFGIGPGAGRVIADMVLGNPAGHDMRRFRFDRFRDGSTLEIGPAL